MSHRHAIEDIRARMGARLAANHADGEAAVVLGDLGIIVRRLRRLEAGLDLVEAACAYCRAEPGDPDLDDGSLYYEMESAHATYRPALQALDDEDDALEDEDRG